MPRIAHITDLHIRRHMPGTATQSVRLSREIPSALNRLTPALKKMGVEILIVTGDLLDVPDDVLAGNENSDADIDWPTAIDADYQMFRRWLESTELPWLVIPGNHDDEIAFDRAFPEWTAITDVAGLRFICFRDHLNTHRRPARTDEQQALFDAVIHDPNHNIAQVHVQHYTIDPPTHHNGWQYEYENAAHLKAELGSITRVKAVLSGHYHPGYPAFSDNGVTYAPTPAFCESPFPYRILDIPIDNENNRRVIATDHALGHALGTSQSSPCP